MYTAKLSGSTTGKSGKTYRYTAGKPIDAPKGDLDHCKSVEWKEVEAEFPKQINGSWYELSNGEKVNGKTNAIEAESKL